MELDNLYQEIILEHYKHPRNHGAVTNADVIINGKNPFCGDEIVLSLKVKDNIVTEVAFEGHGCAISQASASVMTEQIKGKSLQEAKQLFEQFTKMVKGEGDVDTENMDELAAFQGVCDYPTRVKCALLSWNALKKALEGNQK
ncbi:MAG TPA: SUF system NifU family Fe-S cluster assembly protein [bacterium]|nr:SUF system NifU family Fe-S cluster assembly protein [bacterium]HPN45294.1 SUF system NifU family Fe-S cluster assembly protein [bacterium]